MTHQQPIELGAKACMMGDKICDYAHHIDGHFCIKEILMLIRFTLKIPPTFFIVIGGIFMESIVTEPLGLFGWKKFEPVLLAALSIESPILLIGKHGVAKSFILERISEALKLNYRFYNASLINYDDLVGIPIPSKDKTSLEYISNKTSIWDAEVVFIDEINRTKPELQNKLFPIIYERRVQGQNLDKLKFRFVAMNPSYINEDEDETEEYFGTMPLDPALVDRFPFIIQVPTWNDLTKADKRKMLYDKFEGRHEFQVDINEIINKTKKNLEICKEKYKVRFSTYIINFMEQLGVLYGYVSTRRAASMLETLIAIHAAKMTLSEYSEESEKLELIDSACLHATVSVPFTAYKKIEDFELVSISNTAWDIDNESIYSEILSIKDPSKKIEFVIKHKEEIKPKDITQTLITSLSSLDEHKKRAATLISYFNLRDIINIPASTIETLVNEIRPCFEVKHHEELKELWKKRIADQVAKLCGNSTKEIDVNHDNLLNSFLPDGYKDEKEVMALSKYYKGMCERIKNGI